ncbi:MAG: hypothetical protein QME47_01100 [Candidatus Thermoplasmatota archaeon]|nr:hypothetical protein [Candidatus Thermoplasmatota archaeon]
MEEGMRATKRLAELEGHERNLELLCEVVSVAKRTVNVAGKEKTIFSGLLTDGTATLQFTAWKDFNLTENEAIRIQNAYTTVWRNAVQINLGDATLVTKTKEAVTVEKPEYKIKDLTTYMSNVCVTGKILALKQKEVVVKGEKKTCFSGTLGDETGKLPFTAWSDFNLKEGDVIKITNGYVRVAKGLPQLNFDSNATVEKLAVDIEVKDRKLELKELERIGGFDVIIEGFVVDIRPGSGLIIRCPLCKRVIQKDYCALHGEVKGLKDLRIKAVIDDGTSTVDALIGRNLTEQLLGKSMEECADELAVKSSPEAVTEELINKLLANPITLKGYTLRNERGAIFIATDVLKLDRNIVEEARAMLEEL